MVVQDTRVLLFWIFSGLVGYTYVGYPLLIWLLSRLFARPVRKADIRPRVSLIIAAYNEEQVIREKLENCLALTYPREQLEVILVADGSSDSTADIGREYAEAGIRVMHRPERLGKSAALNRAVPEARGEIVFFSDANTMYRPDVVQTMVRSFNDPDVAGVSGRKILVDDASRNATQGETAFWTYESFLKICESRLGSIVTADGEIFAMRKECYRPIPKGMVHDDMFQTLSAVRSGKRIAYEDEATSAEHASLSLRDEFHLKVRYASAGFQIFFAFLGMLVPPRSLFAVQFISHKLFRWLAPFFLLAAFLLSAWIPHPFYRAFFLLQAGFYITALIGIVLPQRLGARMFYFPLYFCMGNAAALYGFFKYLFAGQSTQWRKAAR